MTTSDLPVYVPIFYLKKQLPLADLMSFDLNYGLVLMVLRENLQNLQRKNWHFEIMMFRSNKMSRNLIYTNLVCSTSSLFITFLTNCLRHFISDIIYQRFELFDVALRLGLPPSGNTVTVFHGCPGVKHNTSKSRTIHRSSTVILTI